MFSFPSFISKKDSITMCLMELPGKSGTNICSTLAFQFCVEFEEGFPVIWFRYLQKKNACESLQAHVFPASKCKTLKIIAKLSTRKSQTGQQPKPSRIFQELNTKPRKKVRIWHRSNELKVIFSNVLLHGRSLNSQLIAS